MYKVATFLLYYFWGSPVDMADGLGVLLLTWNQAFYRYGIFDFDRLELCIQENLPRIEHFRKRSVFSFSASDAEDIRLLFDSFLDALKIVSGSAEDNTRSPVAVTKALHLLAPEFFPIWDHRIARKYGCHYNKDPSGKYVLSCRLMKELSEAVKDHLPRSDRTVVKMIDEYNYSKCTQGWI